MATALGVAAYRQRRRQPAIVAALLAYAILLTPNSGLISYGSMLVADRYSYIATMPLHLVVAVGLAGAIAGSRRPRAVALAVCAAVLGLVGVLITLSWTQCQTWRDSNTLRVHALRIGTGRDAILESDLGVNLVFAGHVKEGFTHLHKAIRIDPNNVDARGNLGLALLKQGDPNGAIAQFASAARLEPNRFEPHYDLGMVLLKIGRLKEAGYQLLEAVRCQPRNAEARVSLGTVLALMGLSDEAAKEFTEALRLAPGHVDARRRLDELFDREQSR